jgi:hypothetical protein
VRGIIKIGTSALISMMLVSFFATLAIPTVSAVTTPELRAQSIVNPLLNPGDTIVVSVLVNNVTSLWSAEFKMTFDTNLLTPTGYFFAGGAPTSFTTEFAADLNDAAGYVHLGATRPPFLGKASDFLGVGDGATTSYTLSSGVIEPGSEQAFYKVTGEFIGKAQNYTMPDGSILKRDPGPWRGGGGDGIVNRMPIIPSPYPGVEMLYVNGVPYLSYGDPTDRRWITDYSTGEPRSSQIFEYRSRWPAQGASITMDYATTDTVPAIASVDYAPSGGTGSVTFATAPAVGEKVYMQYRYRTGLTTVGNLLVASIIFRVEGRGVTPLHFESSAMLDQYIPANTIIHNVVDGVFDNRLQATMSAPHIVDTTLITPEVSYFDVFVSVGPWMDKNIEKLWGFQFVMSFDPSIITAVDYETLGIFDMGPNEIGMDYVAISGNSYYGDPDGLSTSVPIQVARIGFVVLDKGVTVLDLHDTYMSDVNGATIIHEVDDGSFANTENVSVSLNTIFVESRKWSAFTDGGLFTLTSQMSNTGDGITKTRAVFKVFDAHGVLVAELTTSEVNILPGTTIRLAEQLNVGPLDKPASYVVEGTVEYIDYLGTWVIGHKGSPTSTRTTMVKIFTLYP